MPPDVKYRGKPLIDLVVYRGGTGVAGIIVLVANGVFDFGLREMSILAAAMVVVWLSATVAMRREFKKSVRRLIRSRDVEARELLVQYLDAGTRTELIEALERDDEKSIVYSISLLEGIDDSEIVKRAGRLLDHSSERVRARGPADRISPRDPSPDSSAGSRALQSLGKPHRINLYRRRAVGKATAGRSEKRGMRHRK